MTCPANVTYTGSALTLCSASVNGAGGLSQSLTVSYSGNTNAGTATASASYPGDANHQPSGDSKNCTIDKAPSTTLVTCPANVTYTASALTPCSASVVGAGGLSQSVGVAYTSNVGPGSASASANFPGDVNHLASGDSKHFLIVYSSGPCLGSPGRQILQPINPDGTSIFKQGSTVPAKFRVCDSAGNSVGTPGLVTSFQLVKRSAGMPETSVNETVVSTTPDTAFRFDTSDKQWIFNINTKSLANNKTYVYLITLNDTTTIEFRFGLK